MSLMSDHSDDDDGSDFYDYGSDEVAVEEDNDSEYTLATTRPDKGKQKSLTIDAKSLSLEALQEMINGDVRRVASITGLQPSIAFVLLQHYRWNEDRLLDQYMDSDQAVLRTSGEPQNVDVVDDYDGAPPASKRARLDPRAAEPFDCPICCESLALEDDTYRARCDHRFCQNCWREYVVANICHEGRCFFKCMQDGCPATMDAVSIERLAPATVFQRYQMLVQQSYVQATSKLRFCPHAGCSETLFCATGCSEMMLNEVVPTVRCGQGHAFCFGCGCDDDHRPLLCKFVKIWNKSAKEDAGTNQWLRANTKDCPKCHNSIEKAGGCNRILCRHCSHQFCWMCMSDWDVHGYNKSTCNAFVEPEPDAAANEAKQNLERWLFYFDRFNNHELSAKLDKALLERTEERMLQVQETSQMSWIEAKFMEQAVDELTMCRLTLKWSYAMAYFLAKGNDKEIFEDLQADLEKAVEQLSQLLEEEIDAGTVKDLRQRMIDKTVYVRHRHEIMLRDTEEGVKQDRWVWTQ
ncbi:hypothetical protein BC835DRAFT_1358164 [Cytidiella melzeri]|nr:hypothetical protein BC835DRAFT_1358164 [Cytidiella melzeri]